MKDTGAAFDVFPWDRIRLFDYEEEYVLLFCDYMWSPIAGPDCWRYYGVITGSASILEGATELKNVDWNLVILK